MAVTEVNESDFEKEVLKSSIPVVVDMWAEWCGPCRMFSPTVEEVAKLFEGKVKFVKMNVDNNQGIAEKYGVMHIPTALFISQGQVKATSIGAVPKETLRKFIEKNLSS